MSFAARRRRSLPISLPILLLLSSTLLAAGCGERPATSAKPASTPAAATAAPARPADTDRIRHPRFTGRRENGR